MFSNPLDFVLNFATLIIAITVHEFSHALAADRLGDPTPQLQKRLTLNPLAHLDPLGTLMILIAPIGWGKPVQFDPFNLRNPRRDAAIISFAGPLANIILATAASLLLRIMMTIQTPLLSHTSESAVIFSSLVIYILRILIAKNILLALFNLIPIHPLDGFKIVGGILSPHQAREWYSLEKSGIYFLIMLILPVFNGNSALSLILNPVLKIVFPLFIPQLSGFI